DRTRARPVRHVTLYESGVGEDVDEDVLRTSLLRLVAIVMDVLEITGGERRRNDERGVPVDRQGRKRVAYGDGAGTHAFSSSGRQAYRVHGSPSVSSSPGKSRKVTRTGIPIFTVDGSTSRSSP